MLLALDCATKTGYCLIDENTGIIIDSGVMNFKRKPGERLGILHNNFRKWLEGYISIHSVTSLCYEKAQFRGLWAAALCVGMTTVVEEVTAVKNIPVYGVMPNSLKKYSTGSGKAKKPAMIKVAKVYLNRQPIDDNEADAVCIGMWGYKEFFEKEKNKKL